jgi:O-acetyl-ADP-ribose deacetylase
MHAAVGKKPFRACAALPIIKQLDTRVRTGDATLLPGLKVKAKYVIGAVGPVFISGDPADSIRLPTRPYELSLARASGEADIASVTMPALSCGVYRFPARRRRVNGDETVS